MAEDKKKPLIILTGPTGVGKTELSIQLAKEINGEIISADSIQVYRHMDIGSAKIRPEEMQGIKHYLIDIINPDEEFNIFQFKNMQKKQWMKSMQREKFQFWLVEPDFIFKVFCMILNFLRKKIRINQSGKI